MGWVVVAVQDPHLGPGYKAGSGSTLGSSLANPLGSRVRHLKLHRAVHLHAPAICCPCSQRTHLLAARLLALGVLAALVGRVQAVCQAGVAVEVAAVHVGVLRRVHLAEADRAG